MFGDKAGKADYNDRKTRKYEVLKDSRERPWMLTW